MLSRRAIRVALFAALVLPALPATVHAQWEFSPFLGRSNPTNSILITNTGDAAIQTEAMTVYGARLARWWSPRWGLEASFGYGRSSIEITSTTQAKFDAGVTQADLAARFRLNGVDGPNGLYLTAGVGIHDLQSAVFDASEKVGSGIEAKSVVAGIVGAGATLAVTDRVAVRFDLTDRIHADDLDIDKAKSGIDADKRSQHDVVVSAGVVVPLGK